jgi:hypothetical protein
VAKKPVSMGTCFGCGKRARFAQRKDAQICLECGYRYALNADGKKVVEVPPAAGTNQAIQGKKDPAKPVLRDGGARRVRLWAGRTSRRK